MKTGVNWRGWGVVVLLGLAGCGQPPEPAPRVAVVTSGAIRMTVPFVGELAARRMDMITAGMQGSAVLEELVPEGTPVAAGDLLARFDTSQFTQDLARQEHERIRAQQELDSLEKAELPLELLDMETRQQEGQAETAVEEHFLESARDLAARGLMSADEVARQEEKVAGLRQRNEQWAQRIALTRDHVHAARLAKAQAALAAAERQREFTAQQVALCEVRAPVAGIVTLVPLPIAGEYRPAHVGDTLFRNQAFLCLPDLSEHVLRGFVDEAELPWVQPGHRVEATPVAYPHARLTGRVEMVGGMAQTRPGDPAWRKRFPVEITLDPLPAPMPVGISVRAEIVAGEQTQALLLPRDAVFWRNLQAVVRRPNGDEIPVQTGLADATRVEIVAGLAAGDEVILP